MSEQDKLRQTIIEALVVAQSGADTDCPIVADIRRLRADQAQHWRPAAA